MEENSMFKRGNRIIVVESSATGRSHPAVGDIGYLDNMFFFFHDRFILADAYFFHYRKDKTSGGRCEKKRFIIDLGMKKHFKNKLGSSGMPARFFLYNNYTVNLTPTAYKLLGSSIAYTPAMQGKYGIWTRKYKNIKHTEKMLNRTIKLPSCHIALANSINGTKYNLAYREYDEVSAWFKSLVPIMDSALSFDKEKNVLYDKTMLIYTKIVSYLMIRMQQDESIAYSIKPTIGPERFITIIQYLRQIQMMSETLMERSDAQIAYQMKEHFITLKKYWRAGGLEKVVSDGHKSSLFAVSLPFVFLRNLMMSSNVHTSLGHMKKYIPWGNSTKIMISNISKAYEIGKEADNNSAALNRFFEEGLIK